MSVANTSDNVGLSGDAHNLPTPSLSDKVEPLQKATKGKILFIISTINYVTVSCQFVCVQSVVMFMLSPVSYTVCVAAFLRNIVLVNNIL